VQDAVSGLEAMAKQAEAAQHVTRGAHAILQGHYVQAEEDLRKAIAINPLNATAHANMGDIFRRQGRYAQAIPWFERALELDPGIEGAAVALAHVRGEISTKARAAAEGRPARIGALIGAVLLGSLSFIAAWFQPMDGVPGYMLITREDWSIVFGFAFAFAVGAFVGAGIGYSLGRRLGRKGSAPRQIAPGIRSGRVRRLEILPA
jgi:tetratricopeptide (TPR) repeat protein